MLLNEKTLAVLDRVARKRVDKFDERLRRTLYKDGNTPPGFVRLEQPEERRVLVSHLRRQALMEREGNAPGDLANAALEHPAVERAVNDELGRQSV